MRLEARVLLLAVVRIVVVGLGAWVALAPQALPDAHVLARAALGTVFLAVALMLGEVDRLRTQFELLVRALRTATAKSPTEDGSVRAAVSILIRALGSREPETREKAHRQLVRLTGQDLPPDRAAWEAWWKGQRAPDGKDTPPS